MRKRIIILVRHGESDHNIKGRIQGQSNSAILTDLGKNQSIAIGEWLRGINIDKVISSPLQRCIETAEIVKQSSNIKSGVIETDNRLIEIDFGPWTGCLRSDIRQNSAEDYSTWRNSPYNLTLNGRHPVRELYQRIESFTKDLNTNSQDNIIYLIVAHRGAIAAMLVNLLGLPKSHHHFLQIDRGSVTILREIGKNKHHIDYELLCANERPGVVASKRIDLITEERTESHGEIYLIRHGQTEANTSKQYQGGQNNPLSELGIANIKNLADSFVPTMPTRLITSPLLRAKESAAIIGKKFNIKTISERIDLHEFLYGVWEGMSEDDVQKYRNTEYSQWKSEPTNLEIPNGEHLNDAYNRCGIVWEYLENDIKSWNGSIVCVAHDIVNRLLICNALDLPAKFIWKFGQTNASVSVISIKSNLDGNLRVLNHSPYSISERLSNDWL